MVTSTEGVVNGQLITLRSPIEGIVTVQPPSVMQRVSAGSMLTQVDSTPVDRSRLEELKTEAATVAERLAALRDHMRSVESFRQGLVTKFNSYRSSMILRVSHELDEARSDEAAAEAVLRQRLYEVGQEQALHQRGFSSLRELTQARSSTEIARANAARAAAAVARVADQRESIKGGVFTGPGDSRNDAPYSQQRIHEIDMQQLRDQTQSREYSVRVAELDRQIRVEGERIQRLSSYAVKAPVDGIVWRRFASAGTSVAPQGELLELVDRSTLFVDAAVNGRYLDDIRPGDRVIIRQMGSNSLATGHIRCVLGEGVADRSSAVEALRPGPHEVHVIVDLSADSTGAGRDRLQVGQRVEVRFPEASKSILRLR